VSEEEIEDMEILEIFQNLEPLQKARFFLSLPTEKKKQLMAALGDVPTDEALELAIAAYKFYIMRTYAAG
jgi:hypothetical protein